MTGFSVWRFQTSIVNVDHFVRDLVLELGIWKVSQLPADEGFFCLKVSDVYCQCGPLCV